MERVPFVNRFRILLDGNIYRSRTFLSLLDIKSHPVAFAEAFETGCVDSRVVNKHVRAVFLFDKPVALAVVEPFHDTTGHNNILLS